MKVNSTILIFLLPFTLFLTSCGGNSDKDVAAQNIDSTVVPVDSLLVPSSSDVQMVISDIPFPFEILEKLYAAKVVFNEKVMNPVSALPTYNQYNSKAMNLGVYGADLSYSVTYEQFQSIGKYVKTTKKLAEDLNIPLAFDQGMMDKYSKFKENKDSLRRVVFSSYSKVDSLLKKDERVGIAALVVTGSWLEGLYISTKTALESSTGASDPELLKTIQDQKKSLVIVIKLLEENKQDTFINALIKDLKNITAGYDHLIDPSSMNLAELKSINAQVSALRKKIVEAN